MWQTRLSKKISGKNRRQKLAVLTPDLYEWATKVRTNIGNEPRNFDFEKFWEEIYRDDSTQMVLVNSRQSYKSTFLTDVVGCSSTSHPGSESLYIVDRPSRLELFSKQRLRKDTFSDNNILRPYLMHGRAAVYNMHLSNGSAIFSRTHHNKYNDAQGMSARVAVFDECQFQELQYRQYALETLQMKGQRFIYAGVGGEEGTEWHNMWLDSKQYEWEWKVSGDYEYFDEVIQDGKVARIQRRWEGMGVRNLLRFEDGTITNTPKEIEEIREGRWVARNPHGKYPGYNITQEMMLRVPLTISDAIYKYKRPKEMSVQYKLLTLPKRLQMTQVYGKFVHTPRIPITQRMVQNCFDNTKSFLSGVEVTRIKKDNKEKVIVFMGIDWGSGKTNASSTVGTITLYWKDIRQFQIADIDVDPHTDSKGDQAFYYVKKFFDYGVDFCVADLGHGEIQVESMQNGGYRSDGKKFEGLGRTRVRGCRTTGGIEKPDEEFREENDKHGKRIDHITAYKTDIIEEYIDLFESKSMDAEQVSQVHGRLVIPTRDDNPVINEIQRQSCSIARVDIDADAEEQLIEDKRQSPEKLYGHPPDIPMSIMYNILAEKHYDEDPFGILPVSHTGVGFGRKRVSR